MTKRALITSLLGFFFLFLSVFFGSASGVLAQDPQPTPSDNEVNQVAKEMFCPVCENTPLDVCPTQACKEWRELIRQKLADGWSDQQIKDYFAVQYGDRVLSEPPRKGLNWLVYVAPWVGIALGGVLVWRVLVGMRSKARSKPDRPLVGVNSDSADMKSSTEEDETGSTPGSSANAADPYLARMEAELKRRDEEQ